LSFNRSIPERWTDQESVSFKNSSFGVSLVDTVDHYQQTMRSAKYSIMFVILTFVVFFFVEVLSKKRIHPVQYLLVGIALILFYSLLLSLAEQIGFGIAYLIAAIAIISLITSYSYSIFKRKTETVILTLILGLLYTYLYVVLQLEDIALLIGSIGLFVILGIIMFISRKIKWYKPEEDILEEK
jgi:inner membrane protein